MRYIVLILLTTLLNSQSMDRVKEKWSQMTERIHTIDFSRVTSVFNKDACFDKLNSLSTTFHNGLNRFVELTVRNDNYTTKEKTIIGAGSVGAIASLCGATYLLKKSRVLKKAALDKQTDLETIEKNTRNELSTLTVDMEIGYTVNGALNNLRSKNPTSSVDFMEGLDAIRDNLRDFTPQALSGNEDFKAQCEAALDKKAIEIVEIMQTHSKPNYQHAVTKVLYESQAQYSQNRLKFFNASHNLENIQNSLNKQKPSQEA